MVFGAFFTEAFFELFEVMLTIIANTMSFLRVVIRFITCWNMIGVYTLAKMVAGGPGIINLGYILVAIIGNIFVMCLEGMIVGIQVLRLEFYEMFSRYYEGKGKTFSINSRKIKKKYLEEKNYEFSYVYFTCYCCWFYYLYH